MRQGVFIEFLEEAVPQGAVHRQGAADDSLGQEIGPVLAVLFLRVLRDLRFHFPCLLPAQPCQFVDGWNAPGAAATAIARWRKWQRGW